VLGRPRHFQQFGDQTIQRLASRRFRARNRHDSAKKDDEKRSHTMSGILGHFLNLAVDGDGKR